MCVLNIMEVMGGCVCRLCCHGALQVLGSG